MDMEMNKKQESQCNKSNSLGKKSYSKPVLTVLGKVSELTAGGSDGTTEGFAPHTDPKDHICGSSSTNKERC